tara:strand:+ start:251 stop:529 length:279 start_codon:yes stop_codon:yes gene_type:complete
MSPKVCKRISRHTDSLLLDWLKTLVPEEEHGKVNLNNLHQFLPAQNYFMVSRTLRLSFYSPKWVRKCIKKLVKQGREVESIGMEDLQRLVTH